MGRTNPNTPARLLGTPGLALVVLTCLTPNASQADIHRCLSRSGEIVFTDVNCPGGSLVMKTERRSARQAARGLSAREIHALNQLDKRLANEQRQRQTARQRWLRTRRLQARAEQRQADRLCESAKTERARIAGIRRRGYSVKESGSLDARQAKNEETLRVNC